MLALGKLEMLFKFPELVKPGIPFAKPDTAMGLSGLAEFCWAEFVGTEFKLPALVQPLAPAEELPVFWLLKLAATKWLLYWDYKRKKHYSKYNNIHKISQSNMGFFFKHQLKLETGS